MKNQKILTLVKGKKMISCSAVRNFHSPNMIKVYLIILSSLRIKVFKFVMTIYEKFFG